MVRDPGKNPRNERSIHICCLCYNFADDFQIFKEADIFRRPSIKLSFYSNKINILLSIKIGFEGQIVAKENYLTLLMLFACLRGNCSRFGQIS